MNVKQLESLKNEGFLRMKIKGRPTLPPRKDVNHTVELPYGTSVFDILEHCVRHLIGLGYTASEVQWLSDHDLTISYSHGYYDEVSLNVEFTTLECEADWIRRQSAYETRLAEYNRWYTENEAEIKLELERRKREEKLAIAKDLEAEVARLTTVLAQKQQQLIERRERERQDELKIEHDLEQLTNMISRTEAELNETKR
jgi:hypothetical protein